SHVSTRRAPSDRDKLVTNGNTRGQRRSLGRRRGDGCGPQRFLPGVIEREHAVGDGYNLLLLTRVTSYPCSAMIAAPSVPRWCRHCRLSAPLRLASGTPKRAFHPVKGPLRNQVAE